jgi:hypothetical protein
MCTHAPGYTFGASPSHVPVTSAFCILSTYNHIVSDLVLTQINPYFRTSGMSEDVLVLLDHVGWTAPREIHIVGISMGGMIAQGRRITYITFNLPPRLARYLTESLCHRADDFHGMYKSSLPASQNALRRWCSPLRLQVDGRGRIFPQSVMFPYVFFLISLSFMCMMC